MVRWGCVRGMRRGEAGRGPPRLEEKRTVGAPLTWEVVTMTAAADVWNCCEKRELPYQSRLCIWTSQNLRGGPGALSDPLELCPFSRMLLTVLSALTERDPLKGNKRDKSWTHSITFGDGWSVKVKLWFETHQQQDTMTLNSEKRGYLVGSGAGVSLFLQYSTVLGCLLRLNYRVSCIVVLLLFTVIAHHLKAHSYNQITIIVMFCSVGVRVSPANTSSSRGMLAVLFVDSNVLQ